MISPEQARQKARNLYSRKFAEWAVTGPAPPIGTRGRAATDS